MELFLERDFKFTLSENYEIFLRQYSLEWGGSNLISIQLKEYNNLKACIHIVHLLIDLHDFHSIDTFMLNGQKVKIDK